MPVFPARFFQGLPLVAVAHEQQIGTRLGLPVWDN